MKWWGKYSPFAAIEGSSVVFYIDDADIKDDDFYHCYMILVQGAKNVIDACRECRVRKLIYNSSADVVFDGVHDIINGDESLSYPWKFQNILNDLKAQAEALILFTNDVDGLLTCAIRPCNVFGPGDTNLVPFFVNLARSGLTKRFSFQFIIGSGENISDFTYVENVSYAHICAEEALDFQTTSVAGKAFFISNLYPIKFWDFLSLIFEGLGYQQPLIKIPAMMVWHIILSIKWIQRKRGFLKCSHSAFHNIQLALYSRTFNCSAAQKHLGYSLEASLDEGVSLTIRSLSHLANDMSFSRYCDRDEPSKVEKLLGCGKVADVLLWRDEKKSFSCFISLVILFNWFLLSGRTFASSAAKLLLLLLLFLFGYGGLPPNIFGFTVMRLSSTWFEIPEHLVKDLIAAIVHLWNGAFHWISFLAKGQDWKFFLKVATFLYFLKLILSQFLTTAVGIALVFVFTAFFIYEQYELEIDGLAKFTCNGAKELAGSLSRNLPDFVESFFCNFGVLNQDQSPEAVKHQK
ncbi:hypothetical protein TIFTF001_033805 [Ficus carica]|uniref:Reticulon-like protein n=1 Tax=Ficus carica TaxID=3494 RepID=A0AA88DYU7_FICCA|nr:hypothetical protein TIFTF001_033805 [Ficus carica]